jgi:cathepsin K
MKAFTVIVAIFALSEIVLSTTVESVFRNEWNEFKLEHGKAYKSLDEENHRYGVYLENREYISQHHQRYALGLETYNMALNHMSDLTYNEVVQQYTGLNLDVT